MSETSITWISETREWRVWTDNPAHAARIERTFGIEPYRTDAQDGYNAGKFFVLPDTYRPFVAKRQMTDAQRAEMAERFKQPTGRGETSAIFNDSEFYDVLDVENEIDGELP